MWNMKYICDDFVRNRVRGVEMTRSVTCAELVNALNAAWPEIADVTNKSKKISMGQAMARAGFVKKHLDGRVFYPGVRLLQHLTTEA